MKVELERITDKPEMAVAKAGGISHENEIKTKEQARELNRKLIEWEHLSPVEFASASFYVEGVSRSFLSQLSRHRHINLMVKSMRYNELGTIEPNSLPKLPNMPEGNGDKYDHRCRLDKNQEKFLSEQYKKGFSIRNLSEEYCVPQGIVQRIIHRSNVKMRGKNEGQLAHVKTDFFKTIDEPIKAYLLGLIFADGSLKKKESGNYELRISQSEKYRPFIYNLARTFGGKVYNDFSDGHNEVVLWFRSKDLAEQVKKHGVTPRKASKIKYPKISSKYDNHFIRGFFDGDGYFSPYDNTSNAKNSLGFTTSSKNFIESLQNKLVEKLNISHNSIYEHKGKETDHLNTYEIKWGSRNDVKTVSEYMYDDFNPIYCHPKKLNKAISISDNIKREYKNKVDKISKNEEVVVPPSIKKKPLLFSGYINTIREQKQLYTNLRHWDVPKEDARFVAPIGTETKLFVRANFREWKHIIELRGLNEHSQWEIRNFAQEVLEYLYYEAPSCFEDLMEEYEENFLNGGES